MNVCNYEIFVYITLRFYCLITFFCEIIILANNKLTNKMVHIANNKLRTNSREQTACYQAISSHTRRLNRVVLDHMTFNREMHVELEGKQHK